MLYAFEIVNYFNQQLTMISQYQSKFIVFLVLTFCCNLIATNDNDTKSETVQVDSSKVKKPYLYGSDALIKLAQLEILIYKQIISHIQSNGESFHSLRKWRLDFEDTSLKATFPGRIPGFPTDKSPEYIISGHPLLTYRMIRRFTIEFAEILQDFGKVSEKSFLNSLNTLEESLRYKWPNVDDLNDSINAILKIHDVYNLTASQITEGIFYDINTKVKLEKVHVFEIGTFALETDQFVLGLEWLLLAQNMISKIQTKDDANLTLDFIQLKIDELIEKHNQNWRTKSFTPGPEQFNYFTKKLQNESVTLYSSKGPRPHTLKEIGFKFLKGNRTQNSNVIDYYALCSGENLQTAEELMKLKCWYERSKTPELQLFPAKIEQLSTNPSFVKIHEAIGPKVASKLKELSLSTQYVEIYKPTTTSNSSIENKLEYFSSRASANSWVSDSLDYSLRLLSRRIESITGYNVVGETASDDFEVVAYSCGGNFVLHNDALEDVKTELRGDRISTVLFYLDDVVLGGRTAYPRIGITIKPEAGTALFWDNLFLDGSVDDKTIHAACPVILGQKWTVNRCLTEHGNFLKRKCPVNYNFHKNL